MKYNTIKNRSILWLRFFTLIVILQCSLLVPCCIAFIPPLSSSIVTTTTTKEGRCLTKNNDVPLKSTTSSNIVLSMSFYDDFENFDNPKDDDDDDDDEDDEVADVDDAAVANFRSRMGSLFGEEDSSSSPSESSSEESGVDELIRRANEASGKANKEEKDWAKAVNFENLTTTKKLEGGMVLIANPEKFCSDFGGNNKNKKPSTSLLSKFGLTLPPPADLDPDRRADLLPVLCILDRHPLKGSQAVLLNRRTGYLLGDLEQQQQQQNDGDTSSEDQQQQGPPPPPQLSAFMIQPLWFGGTASGSNGIAGESSTAASGLDMIHQCALVDGAKQLTEDGLYWGGDPVQAQDAMSEPREDGKLYTGFDFKFFVQSTRWLPTALEREIKDGTWFCANVSKEVLFKPRDRMGTRRAKPLWTEIMELMGGTYLETKNKFYEEE